MRNYNTIAEVQTSLNTTAKQNLALGNEPNMTILSLRCRSHRTPKQHGIHAQGRQARPSEGTLTGYAGVGAQQPASFAGVEAQHPAGVEAQQPASFGTHPHKLCWRRSTAACFSASTSSCWRRSTVSSPGPSPHLGMGMRLCSWALATCMPSVNHITSSLSFLTSHPRR